MTEDEAKTKWCPSMGKALMGSPDYSIEECGCIASDCMMWESEHQLESKQIVKGEDIPKGWHIVSNDVDLKQTIGRYCKIASGDCGLKSKECNCTQ